MQKPIASLMAVGLLLLAACGTGGKVEPGPITSFEDFVGTYEDQGPGEQLYLHIFEDGTWHFSENRDLVEDRPLAINETGFEGTKVFLKTIKGPCLPDDPDAIYEVHLMENGNLQFVPIEDPCAARLSLYPSAEWEPVP